MQALLNHLLHHILNQLMAHWLIGILSGLFSGWFFENLFRYEMTFVVVPYGIIVTHESKVMIGRLAHMIMVSFLMDMLRANVASHHHRSFDFDLVTIMTFRGIRFMVYVLDMNFVSMYGDGSFRITLCFVFRSNIVFRIA